MAGSRFAVLNEMCRTGVGVVRQALPSRLDGRVCEDVEDSRASRKLHVKRKLPPQTKAGAAGFGLALRVVRACHLQGCKADDSSRFLLRTIERLLVFSTSYVVCGTTKRERILFLAPFFPPGRLISLRH